MTHFLSFRERSSLLRRLRCGTRHCFLFSCNLSEQLSRGDFLFHLYVILLGLNIASSQGTHYFFLLRKRTRKQVFSHVFHTELGQKVRSLSASAHGLRHFKSKSCVPAQFQLFSLWMISS